MAATKTETITVRIEPAVKQGLKAMANRERRSIANMVEVLIRDYCGRNGIEIAETAPEDPSGSGDRTRK